MKLLHLLAGCSLLGLSSCALSSDKPKEDGLEGGSIPPPKNLQPSDTTANLPEELPELTASSQPDAKPTTDVNVKEIDGFRYKNILDDLPSQRDLASPPTPTIPAQAEESQSSQIELLDKPLVTNP